MKVVQLCTQPTGGPVDHAVDVALELTDRGHEVLAVVPAGPAATTLRSRGVRHLDVGPRTKGDLAGTRDLVRLLRRERPDVLHLQDRRAGLVGRLAAPVLSSRVVYTLHGVPDRLSGLVAGNLQVAPPRPVDRLANLHLERWLGLPARGSAVVLPSEALRGYAVRHVGWSPARLHVVHNGIDAARFLPGPRRRRDGTLDLVFIGVLAPVKRLDVLLRAVAATTGVRLRLAGTGPLEAPLRALSTELRIDDRVEWLGWVDDPSALLTGADALALTSAAENMPLAVLQAMSAGTAVVATRVGGVPEIITDGEDGLLVAPGDVDQLASALSRMRDAAGLRDRLGDRARRRVLDRFTVRTMVDGLLEVYG